MKAFQALNGGASTLLEVYSRILNWRYYLEYPSEHIIFIENPIIEATSV